MFHHLSCCHERTCMKGFGLEPHVVEFLNPEALKLVSPQTRSLSYQPCACDGVELAANFPDALHVNIVGPLLIIAPRAFRNCTLGSTCCTRVHPHGGYQSPPLTLWCDENLPNPWCLLEESGALLERNVCRASIQMYPDAEV